MKKVLSLICFSIPFLATYARSVSRDTASVKHSTETSKRGSKNSILKLEAYLDERYNVVTAHSVQPIGKGRFALDGKGIYASKTPILKIPTDPNVHYHMQHKKSDINYAAPMPNSFKDSIPLGNSTNFRVEHNPSRPLYKLEFLPDSLMHRHDSPLKCNGYKAE